MVAVVSLRLGYRFEGRLAWGSLAIVLTGTVLTVGGINPKTDQGGIILALLSPIAYAIYIVITAWMAGERPGQTADMRSRGKGAEVSPPVAGAIMMTGTWMTMLALGIATREPILPTQIPSDAWIGLVGIGVFAAAIAIQAFYASAARIGAAQASLMATVEPIVVILLGITFLGESFAPIRVVGAAVVLAGVLLAQFATPSESRPVLIEEP